MNGKPTLVAFDLDGTLAESKQPVTTDLGTLLARLMKKMPVAVMSGAGFRQFESQFLPALPSDANFNNLYLFPANASQCYQNNNQNNKGVWLHVYDETFTQLERERVLHALAEALEETGLAEPPPQLWGDQIEDRGSQISWSALGQQAPVEEKKKWDPDRKKRLPLREAFLKRAPDFSAGINASNTLDITRKGVTKAYGIGKLSELTGISVSEMLYVGDALKEGGNDYVVVQTGIRTQEVSGPIETAKIIGEILA
ncbi:MAG: HAD-IIB family hydrolase [bacterium]|nr:HAD-IIB family hydrolase [bacterium]